MKQDWEKDQWNDEVITLCHVILSTLDDQQENNSVETLKCNHVNKFLSLLPSTSWFRFPHTLLKKGYCCEEINFLLLPHPWTYLGKSIENFFSAISRARPLRP